MHKLALFSLQKWQKIRSKMWDSSVFDIKNRDGWRVCNIPLLLLGYHIYPFMVYSHYSETLGERENSFSWDVASYPDPSFLFSPKEPVVGGYLGCSSRERGGNKEESDVQSLIW